VPEVASPFREDARADDVGAISQLILVAPQHPQTAGGLRPRDQGFAHQNRLEQCHVVVFAQTPIE
jgi:hypothetical protein